MEVHRVLGTGFLEAVYQEAMAIELNERNISFKKEVNLPIHYRGKKLSIGYRADFICYEEVIVELKALATLGNVEESQIINYLKCSGLKIGLLINFGSESLQHKRFVFSKSA